MTRAKRSRTTDTRSDSFAANTKRRASSQVRRIWLSNLVRSRLYSDPRSKWRYRPDDAGPSGRELSCRSQPQRHGPCRARCSPCRCRDSKHVPLCAFPRRLGRGGDPRPSRPHGCNHAHLVRQQVIGNTIRVFADQSAIVRTHRIKISKNRDAPARLRYG